MDPRVLKEEGVCLWVVGVPVTHTQDRYELSMDKKLHKNKNKKSVKVRR